MNISFVASKTENHIDSLKNDFDKIIELLKLFNINNATRSNLYETTSSKKNKEIIKKYQILLNISSPEDIINFHENIC